VAKSLAKRFKLGRCRLFVADGTTFAEGPVDVCDPRNDKESRVKYPVLDTARSESPVKSTTSCIDGNHLSKTSVEVYIDGGGLSYPSSPPKPKLIYSSTEYRRMITIKVGPVYDKVLVDAPCTHDGSAKHVLKMISRLSQAGPSSPVFKEMCDLYSESTLGRLYETQLDLLMRGFQLLKPHGILVYSTCSLTRRQNETIVETFLERLSPSQVQIVEPAGPAEWRVPINYSHPCMGEGQALRVKPGDAAGGGFFLCRFRRLE
jgi:hypothetical protein